MKHNSNVILVGAGVGAFVYYQLQRGYPDALSAKKAALFAGIGGGAAAVASHFAPRHPWLALGASVGALVLVVGKSLG